MVLRAVRLFPSTLLRLSGVKELYNNYRTKRNAYARRSRIRRIFRQAQIIEQIKALLTDKARRIWGYLVSLEISRHSGVLPSGASVTYETSMRLTIMHVEVFDNVKTTRSWDRF